MDVSVYKRKFKLLFAKLLKGNIEISKRHTECLIEMLDASRNTSIGKIMETPFFAEFIILALQHYHSVSNSVKVFIIKLLSIVLHNEVDFNRFHLMQGFELLVAHGRAGHHSRSAELNHAYRGMLLALVSHYSGVRFVMEHKSYKDVMTSHARKRNRDAAAGVFDFMSKLVWKLNEYDEEAALLEALQFIAQPIVDYDNDAPENISLKFEIDIFDTFMAKLHILLAILDEVEHVIKPNNVVPILSNVFSMESRLTALLERTPDAALGGLLAAACLRLRFAAGRRSAPPDLAAEAALNEDLNVTFNNLLCILIKKKSVAVVLDFASRCHIFWHKVEALVPPISFERFGRQYQMGNQFLTIMLVPILARNKSEEKLVTDHEIQKAIREFSTSLAVIVTYDVTKAAYRMRDLIKESESPVAACACSVRELARLRGRLSRRQACIAFQALYYALSEYVLTDGAGDLVLGANPLRTPQDALLVAATLDGIEMLLEDHEITWYESSEIANLQAALMNLIKQNILPTELLVRVLALAALSARKLLPPELALQLRSARGGSLGEMGAAAAALLAHTAPAARVAALKLLQTLTEIAYIKFVPLRKVISEHGLMAAAAHAARRDPAPGARAAALRCLIAATRCECLWKDLLTRYDNLYEQLVHMLQHNPEGEIRKEAANVLTHVYINHKVTNTFSVCVSRVMATAALHDPHRDVKIAALNYWRQFATNQFTDRGMIDGRFPTVTFCKKKRKIITLTDKEIHNQIESAMDCLSSIGCLTVLLRCLSPLNHYEVIEKANYITGEFVAALDHYKFDLAETATPQIPMIQHQQDADFSNNPSPQTPEGVPLPVSAVMDNNLSQIDLISEILECLRSDPAVNDPKESPVEIVSPKEFLAIYRATDYKAIIESKKKTSEEDLDTLIDEMISGEYKQCPLSDT